MGDGLSTSFWLDNWSELGLPLLDLIGGYEGYADCNERVVDYVTSEGEWDRSRLDMWFHPHEVDRIVSAHPPSAEKGEDKFY